jgi:hypothetical protein
MNPQVVLMRRWVSQDTVRLLAALLDLAQRGEVNGITLCYKLSDGGEHTEVTGHYRRVPKDGLASAMRMSVALNEVEDRHTGST